MAPAAGSDRAETSLASNTRSRPQKFIAVLIFLEIVVGVVLFHRPIGVLMRDRGVELVAEFFPRWSVHQRRATLIHRSGSPEALCPIYFPSRLFLLGGKR